MFGGLTREPILTAPPPDAGPDTKSLESGIKVASPTVATLDPGTVYAPCAPMRYDITTFGRTCWDLAKTTPTGTFTVTPIFGSAPPAIRDTHCAVTWIGKAGTCAYPDWDALSLSCAERHSKVQRSAACAADPSACNVSGSTSTVPTPTTAKDAWSCDEIWGPDAGIIPNGYNGGCDSCGVVSGGMLYLTNPYDSSTILTNVTTAGGTQQVSVSIPAFTTTAIAVPSTYSSGSIYIWRP